MSAGNSSRKVGCDEEKGNVGFIEGRFWFYLVLFF